MKISALSMLILIAASAGALAANPHEQAMRAGSKAYAVKDADRALASYTRAVELAVTDEEKASALYEVGRVHYYLTRDYPKGRRAYEQILELDNAEEKRKDNARSMIGHCKRQHDQVLLHTKGHPYHTSKEQFRIGYEHWLDRYFAKARQAFARASEIRGGYPTYRALSLFFIGYSCYSERKYEDARPALARVLEAADVPASYRSDAQRYIARTYLHERNYVAARVAYAKLLATEDAHSAHVQEAQDIIPQLEQDKADVTVPSGREATPEEKDAQRRIVLARMRQEGLSRENCRLTGTIVQGYYESPSPYPPEGFPHKWDFDDGSLCGIGETGRGIANLRVEDGKLKFTTGAAGTLSYYEWDQISGEPGEKVDVTERGENTSFSEDARTMTVSLRSIDDASILVTPSLDMPTEPGGEQRTPSASVASLIGDEDMEGVAVYSLSSPDGKWQYSTDNGVNWQEPGAVSEETALLLRPTDLLYYVSHGGDIETAHLSWGNFDLMQPALNFGYGTGHGDDCPVMSDVQIRLRQSLAKSKWQITHKSVRRGRVTVNEADEFTVTGRDWQTVALPTESARPPYPAFRLICKTPGNRVEIDWVRPCVREGPSYCRKTLTLPSDVRWAKCSISASGRFRLYVNGKEAVRSPPLCHHEQIWNYDIDPGPFRKGKNVIAYEGAARFLVDGALLCDDGSYHRFDTDASWKSTGTVEGKEWREAEHDDAAWQNVVIPHVRYAYAGFLPPEEQIDKAWFNPSYKGRISVAPADGRPQPIYGSTEPVALEVAIPSISGKEQAVTWQAFDEMGDHFHAEDKLVKEGKLSLATKGNDKIGVIAFRAGELPHNAAYAIVLRLEEDGKEIDRRRYEIAICGPVEQPVVDAPKTYTDGMELRLVWEVDAAADQGKGSFIATDGRQNYVETKVVETPLGRFRQMRSGPRHHFMSFRYQIERPGRPHLAISEYPDDTQRLQEMRLTEPSILGYDTAGMTELGNDTAALGIANPLTHELRHLHVVFFPNHKIGAVSIVGAGTRVGKIRIYEILNDIPMRKIEDAPGQPKWFGQVPERGPYQVMQSCFTSPIAPVIRKSLILSDTPNFYRNWMVTYINLVKRLRFAGENTYFMGQYMYISASYPSRYSYNVNFTGKYSGSLRDSGALMAKMFEENGLGFFSGLEMAGLAAVTATGTDDQIAQGQPTFSQVDKDGHQHIFLRRRYPYPNWIHPEVRKHFETVIDELIALYGNQKGWQGIVLQANESLGPSWICRGGDPYFASYDDYTVSLFEKETGVRIPVKDADFRRFRKRYEWLLANARKEWTDWRCDKMSDIYEWVRDRLKSARDDLKLILYSQAGSYNIPHVKGDGVKNLPVFDHARQGGLDIQRLKDDRDIVFVISVSSNKFNRPTWRYLARSEEHLGRYANDGVNGAAVRNMWYETQVFAPEGWVFYYTSPEAWPLPSSEFFANYFTNVFVRTNPAVLLHPLQDVLMWMGRETSVSRFAKAFRSIPAAKYIRLRGRGRDKNAWVAVARYGNDVYGYVANPQWWTVDAEVAFADGVKARDLIKEVELPGGVWKLRLAPFAIHTFRASGPDGDAIVSCSATVSAKGQAHTRDLLQQLETEVRGAAEALRSSGSEQAVKQLVRDATQAIAAGDFSQAYDLLTVSPALQRLKGAASATAAQQPAPENPFQAQADGFCTAARRAMKKRRWADALGLYLRAWGLHLRDDRPARWQEIEKAIGECLLELGKRDEAKRWRDWLAQPSAERVRCPILGIGVMPPDMAMQWDAAPERVVRNSVGALLTYGKALCMAGRIREAKLVFERAQYLAPKSSSSRDRREAPAMAERLLRYCSKWGREPPARAP